MGFVLEIGARIKGKQPTHIGVERKRVPKVVIAHECRVLAVDHPIHAGVHKLAMQQAGTGSKQRWVDPNLGRICGTDRHWGGLAALEMLVRSKPEQFVLDQLASGIRGVVVQLQFWLRRGRR